MIRLLKGNGETKQVEAVHYPACTRQFFIDFPCQFVHPSSTCMRWSDKTTKKARLRENHRGKKGTQRALH